MFDWFDPTNWDMFTFEQYEHWWFMIVNVLFRGMWPKIIATACLTISVYSVVRKKFRPIIGLVCFFVAVFFAYVGTVLTWIFE